MVAAHWAELRDEEDVKYYYNSILGRTQWIEPQIPTKIPLDDEGTLLMAEDENDRVMPSRSDLLSSGRYDLNSAIRYHGGYRAVGHTSISISLLSIAPTPINIAPLLRQLQQEIVVKIEEAV